MAPPGPPSVGGRASSLAPSTASSTSVPLGGPAKTVQLFSPAEIDDLIDWDDTPVASPTATPSITAMDLDVSANLSVIPGNNVSYY